MTAARGDRVRFLIVGIVVFDVLLVPVAVFSSVQWARYQPSYGSDPVSWLLTVGTLVQLGVAALVAVRRPRHPVGWLLLASTTANLVDSGLLQPYVIYAIYVTHRSLPGGDLVGTVDQMMWMAFVVPIAVFLPMVFPSGRVLSRRWRPVLWLAFAATVTGFFGGSFAARQDPGQLITGVHPVRLPQPFTSIADVMQDAIFLLPVCVLAGVVAMILRYRRGASDERHQIKWLIAAVTIYLVGFAASIVPTMLGFHIPVLQDVAVVGLALIPVAATIAVLKYRLYDIDIVISRALVYGSLAVFITAVYVGIVVGVGALVGSGGKPNLALSIAATAVVAVAFQPVRDRVQHLANRLVYGKRATPYEVLSQFSERVSESYANEDVLPRMARVMAEGVGATGAEVWLRNGSVLTCVGSWSVGGATPPGNDERVVEVRHQGDLLGALSVTKRTGEPLTPIEQKLLDDLAHQAGLVLKNVGLTADLQARLEELRGSRQRLVAAQDEERRRLERNLHDGAQQHLVALKVKLGLAEMMLTRDPARARTIIEQLKGDADEALETLRDLARGIYPPLLADKGLEAALESQARKATIPVEVRAEGIGRYPQDIEAAVYFCCLEALQNVQKYARAGGATVSLTAEPSALRFEVQDDGAGFDPSTITRGAGLQNIKDRLDALGGTLELHSSPGAGTTLVASMPAERPALEPAMLQ